MVVKQVSEIVSAYREANKYPTPVSANISLHSEGETIILQSKWSQKDLDRKEKISFVRTHLFSPTSGDVIGCWGPQEVKHELWNKSSPSGKLRAVVRQYKDKKNEEKQFLEIFDKTKKLKTIDILACEKHGKIIENDGQFGSFEWSRSEEQLLYIADKKKPKSASFFNVKSTGDKNSGDEQTKVGDEYVYTETWGEQLNDYPQPVICIFDIKTCEIKVLDNFLSDQSPGQALWAPNDAGIVVCCWVNVPYKLGLRFCFQRRSALYFIDLQKSSEEILSESGRAVRFPRFSLDMSKLIYLDVPAYGAHNQCARLVKIDWQTRERKVVVDTVTSVPAPEFPGIYSTDLAQQIWFDDNIHLALASSWRSTTAVLIVNTETGTLTKINNGSSPDNKDHSSYGFLGVQDNYILLYCSAINQPFYLMVGKVNDASKPETITWMYPDGPKEELDWLTFSIYQHQPDIDRKHPKYDALDYESLLCLPKTIGDHLPPLIVWTHGGPNAVFDIAFNSTTAFFCKCGFAVLMINYRGSTGFGQDSILSLTGNIGFQDVKDVQSAVQDILQTGHVDKNFLYKFGGSHGGFLTLHMIGQYPELFKAAATRNPVVDLTSMQSSDIPDWLFAQSGLLFNFLSLADDKILPHLWQSSPISHVNKMKTPVLLMIGLEDKRVPPSQGYELYKALKARDVPIRYLTYPGNNHSIADVEAEADCMVNTVVWFNTYPSQ